jgi:membrane-bound ClpP family serine protease
MTEWAIVISLVSFGLLLLVVEVIFIPGTTIVGVGGVVCILIAITLSFKYFGSEGGWMTLAGSMVASGGLFYLAFRTKAWNRFTITTSIDGRANEIETSKFILGMEGKAISALRPSGKGEFENHIVEVRTLGDYVDSGTPIRIIRILPNQVLVESVIGKQ